MVKPAKVGCGVSWFVIVLLFGACFPVALYFMMAKLHREPWNYRRNAMGVTFFGGFFIFIGACFGVALLNGGFVGPLTVGSFLGIAVTLALPIGGGCSMIHNAQAYKKLGIELEKQLAASAACTAEEPLVEYEEEAPAAPVRTESFDVVKCPNCGATNAVLSGQNVCEYCGSPLSGAYAGQE